MRQLRSHTRRIYAATVVDEDEIDEYDEDGDNNEPGNAPFPRGGAMQDDVAIEFEDDDAGSDFVACELEERDENGLYLYERLGETFERELLAFGTSFCIDGSQISEMNLNVSR